jgi:hypothetical protein
LKIFRNRRGELIPLIAIICLGLVELSTRRIFHDDNYYQREHWPIPLGFLLSAAVIRILTQRKPSALASQPQEWLISSSSDPVQGGMDPGPSAEKWKLFRERDSYFLVPVRFWPWVLCGLGILFYFLPRSLFE